MISETLTPTSTLSSVGTFTKGNAQMAVQSYDGATGYIKLWFTVAGLEIPIFEGKLPRKAAKIVVVADATEQFQFEWTVGDDCPDNATVKVYMGQED